MAIGNKMTTPQPDTVERLIKVIEQLQKAFIEQQEMNKILVKRIDIAHSRIDLLVNQVKEIQTKLESANV